jgi:hypothetical protein
MVAPADARAELDLTLHVPSHGPNPVSRGGLVHYAFVVDNVGTQNASGATLTVRLPKQLRLSSYEAPFSGAVCRGLRTIVCRFGILCPGSANDCEGPSSQPIEIVARARSPGTGRMHAGVTLAGFGPDATPGDNRASFPVRVRARRPAADLSLSIQQPARAETGIPAWYELPVQNAGPTEANGLRITFRVFGTGRVVGADMRRGFDDCNPTTEEQTVVVCTLRYLQERTTAVARLAVITPTDGAVRVDVRVSARTRDPRLRNNASVMTTNFVAPSRTADLGVEVTASHTRAAVGESITYTARVTNYGPDAATEVLALVFLVVGGASVPLELVDFGASQGACAIPIECHLGTLAPGATATVAIVIRPLAPGTLGLVALVEGSDDAADPGVWAFGPPGHRNQDEVETVVS